ncbi:MAG: GDSL-type esterase/lipase family protein [Eubacterium sp.]|nr:GDSL-type esterase/lipase family protein [Eubacterium sp.]
MIGSDKIGIKAIAREAEIAIAQTIGTSISVWESLTDQPAEAAGDQMATDDADLEIPDGNESIKMENEGECKEENINIQNENNLNKDGNTEQIQENSEEKVKGVTNFDTYEPQATDSRYYSDAGKVALTTEYPYHMENDSYFKDAAFLGDSRTLGISDYAGLDQADFYCDSGMTIFKLLEPDGVTYQKTGEKVDLSQVLQEKQYGKIYIMLGMNELGYGNTQMYLEQYREVVEQIKEWQPDSIIYIMANLHVSREKNNMETEFNNININDKNAAAAQLANGMDIFYLDANPLFTDEEGFLNADLTFDGVHLYAQHYDVWRRFLLEHAVEPDEDDGKPSS